MQLMLYVIENLQSLGKSFFFPSFHKKKRRKHKKNTVQNEMSIFPASISVSVPWFSDSSLHHDAISIHLAAAASSIQLIEIDIRSHSSFSLQPLKRRRKRNIKEKTKEFGGGCCCWNGRVAISWILPFVIISAILTQQSFGSDGKLLCFLYSSTVEPIFTWCASRL